MKDNSIKWVFPSAKECKRRMADTSFNGRLLSLTVLLSVPRGTASGSRIPHHHCKSKIFQQTCWLQTTRTALVFPPFQRLIRGSSKFEHLKGPKLPLLSYRYRPCKMQVPRRIEPRARTYLQTAPMVKPGGREVGRSFKE